MGNVDHLTQSHDLGWYALSGALGSLALDHPGYAIPNGEFERPRANLKRQVVNFFSILPRMSVYDGAAIPDGNPPTVPGPS
eukprot:9284186-Pyramimonas_sp.AAC.2